MSNPKKEKIPPSSSAQKVTSASSSYPRHIKLPFDLRDLSIKIEGEVEKTLFKIFPGTTEILCTIGRSCLHFAVEKFPPAPWPLTIAGLPITIDEGPGPISIAQGASSSSSPRGKGLLFPKFTPGNSSIRICRDWNSSSVSFSATSFRNLADAVTRELFTLLPGLPLVEVLLSAEKMFYIILEDKVNIPVVSRQLPLWIAGCWTQYLHDKDMCRPKGSMSRREVLPNPVHGIIDTTPHDVLRPGVAIFSPTSADERLDTTAGVMVKNNAGDHFMTAASHGIGQTGLLFQIQPMGGRRGIGEAVQEISFTDVAVVKLKNGINFINEPFDQEGESVPRLTRLYGEASDDPIDLNLEVSFNSPYIGAIAGIVVAKSFKMAVNPPATSTEERMRYVVYQWTWIGQDPTSAEQRVPESACGSPLWDSDGRVMGFFQYYIQKGKLEGLYASVSADEVVRAGYRLARVD